MPRVNIPAGPYRVYFVSHDLGEPAHVHVDRERMSAKFWLNPIKLARNRRFSNRELRKIERLLEQYEQECLEAWDEHMGRQSR